jgi:hypothetical protein
MESNMINKFLGAATTAAVIVAGAPASAARMGGCSGDNLAKTEAAIEAMAEGEGKIMAQKEVAMAQYRNAGWQDGRLRDAYSARDARWHDEVAGSGAGPIAL